MCRIQCMTGLSRDEQQRRWEAFRTRPGNRTCAECTARDTTWAVLDYGILICIHCAGAHRALGSHISKVRSTELDDMDESLFLWFESLGNQKNNERWEAELPATVRRPLDNPYDSPECIRRWWLRAKYDEMRFLAGSEHAGQSHATMRGWLAKQGAVLPTSKRRFFVVERGLLLCYPDDSCDASRARAFPLAGAAVSMDSTDSMRFRLTLRPPDGVALRPPVQAHAVLVLRVDSGDPRHAVAELESWIWCARAHAVHTHTVHTNAVCKADLEARTWCVAIPAAGGTRRRRVFPA